MLSRRFMMLAIFAIIVRFGDGRAMICINMDGTVNLCEQITNIFSCAWVLLPMFMFL